MGEMDTMFGERNCGMDPCYRASVVSLAQQDLCLTHFLSRCYEHLERLDPRVRHAERGSFDAAGSKALVDECSRKALDVSLQCRDISNLERGRLLDILLWAGELFITLRQPAAVLRENIYESVGAPLKRFAARRS